MLFLSLGGSDCKSCVQLSKAVTIAVMSNVSLAHTASTGGCKYVSIMRNVACVDNEGSLLALFACSNTLLG